MIRRLLQITVVILITLLAAEGVFRVYHYFNPTFIFCSNNYNRFRGKPFGRDYQFHLNSKGFKDVERTAAKPSNAFRTLCIGDSFVFGVVPYEYNFITLLAKKVDQGKGRFEFINMGIPSIGPDSYFALLNREGLSYSPDMVICCLFIGNDFTDAPIENKTHSYLYEFLKYVFKVYPVYAGRIIHEAARYNDGRGTLDPRQYLMMEKVRSCIFLKDAAKDEEFLGSMNRAVSYLKGMKAVCDLHHMKFLVVLIPDEMQVDPVLRERVLQTYEDGDPQKFDFGLPNRILNEELVQAGISYLDLLSDFVARSKNKRYYKPEDSHWNIAGNELASDLIALKVKELLGLSEKAP